ncbi:acetyltransferase (GNAT) family protein [Mucilaginibacter gracilis]|uniref:Acetyltransferase (GNAT) family protein n=1 Tax=Mucilaginibacter gracilis TaxID=423350 RepID=A0A495J505_9SPHI|nr:GNAT family N-acetyltransferase [Mucilaginibacter gracilis]RKR83833.1 acetyltransferase (GNAT) family protein [Mucilaginibacter gracilis]
MDNYQHLIANGYTISTDKSLLDFEVIFNYLGYESYWSKGIAPETLRKAIDNAMCFGGYHHKKQIGFAKVVTDKATFAYLADVFILEPYRGLGLSKWLVHTIKLHPDLQGLRRWMLATADAHGLYAQFGFEPVNNPERWMQIFTPYQTNN